MALSVSVSDGVTSKVSVRSDRETVSLCDLVSPLDDMLRLPDSVTVSVGESVGSDSLTLRDGLLVMLSVTETDTSDLVRDIDLDALSVKVMEAVGRDTLRLADGV